MFKITLIITIFAFLLFRPNTLNGAILHAGDDWSYFAHASSLAFGMFPHYDKEHWIEGQGLPAHPIGPGILAAPFVAFFSLFDRMAGSSIINQRTEENVLDSWTLFGFIFATAVYFWWACALLFLGLKEYFSENIASWSVLLLVLLEGAPLFAFRRPIFGHVYSFFALCVLLYMLMVFMKRKKDMRFLDIMIAGLACGLTILTRFNDVFLGMAWPIILVVYGLPHANLKKKITSLAAMYVIMGLMILYFYVFPKLAVTHDPVFMGDRLLIGHPLGLYIKRIFHILFGQDWGLIFTAPFILIALGGLVTIKTALIKPLRWLSCFLVINFWIIIQWMTQGGWYGYRYFIFTAFVILAYPFAYLLDLAYKRWGKRIILPISLIALFPLLSMICFEGVTPDFSLHNCMQYFGVEGWGNNTYQRAIWDIIINSPIDFIEAIGKGGPTYFLNLILIAFHKTSILPMEVWLPYLSITWEMFYKSMLIYVTPFSLWGISRLFFSWSQESRLKKEDHPACS
ncbi:MAG: hypothetical protein HQL13_05695 [Candidatus Omnitrophica bacterium]|nr:hypothetical protein [Candidatus Omnitrophota bacterium]